MQSITVKAAISELLVELNIDLVSIGDVVSSANEHNISAADVRPFAEQALLALVDAGAVPTVWSIDGGYSRAKEYGNAPAEWIPAVLDKWLDRARTLDPEFTLAIWFSKGAFGPVSACIVEFQSERGARAAAADFVRKGYGAAIRPRMKGKPNEFPFHVLVEVPPDAPTGVTRDRSNEIMDIAQDHGGLVGRITRQEQKR